MLTHIRDEHCIVVYESCRDLYKLPCQLQAKEYDAYKPLHAIKLNSCDSTKFVAYWSNPSVMSIKREPFHYATLFQA